MTSVIVPVRDDGHLQAMVAVHARVYPDHPPPLLENLRHNLASSQDLAYRVALAGAEPVGYGLVEIDDSPHPFARVAVVREARRRGIGSALLAEISTCARDRDRSWLQGEVLQGDEGSLHYFERRGYEVVGGQKGVSLDVAAAAAVAVEPPPGIRIVTRAERPDVVEGMYAVSLEAEADVPGNESRRSFERWHAKEIERPSLRPELCFIALAADEVVGWASLDHAGSHAYHRWTVVRRAWRGRGIATALKRVEIRAAKELGFERLVTSSEERNLPMRRLNEKLGYRPDPTASTVVLRGPVA